MSVVVGIPLIKGNSQEIVPTRYDPANYVANGKPLTGHAQSFVDGGVEPEIVPFNQGRFLGFACEIGNCGNVCSIVRSALSLPVVALNAAALTVGDSVFLNTDGLVVEPAFPASFEVNGTIEQITGVTGIDGKTGLVIPEVVLINFGSGRTTNSTV